MFVLLKNVFKKKPKKEKPKYSKSLDPIPFETVDERRMSQIEDEYFEKQAMDEVPGRKSQLFQPKAEQAHKEMQEFVQYEVKEDDSLFGIALKFNMCPQQLMKLNSLSGDIVFKGMNLIIPIQNLPRNSITRQSLTNEKNVNIWQSDNLYHRFEMFYCIPNGHIMGSLQLTPDVILFDPKPQQNGKIKYNACISMYDINESAYHILRNMNGQKDYVVQILLSGIGKHAIEQKFEKKLLKLKKEKRSIATVFFRHAERDLDGTLFTEEKKKENCIFISQYISNASNGYDVKNPITSIPYVDVTLKSNKITQIIEEEQTNMMEERMDRLWSSLEYVPKLDCETKTLNESSYKQLIEQVPAVFRLAKWYVRFSNCEDGSSYGQLMKDLKYQSPLIFVITDTNLNTFGAYVSSELLHHSKGFYGNGEAFLFQFERTNEIKPYHWTEKNQDFIFSDKDGIGFGCGDKFGLYIDKSLSFGYSNHCDTYNNPPFTETEKFVIKYLEIWTIQTD